MSALGGVLAAGLVLLAVAAVTDMIAGVRWPKLTPVPYLLGTAASGCLAVAGAGALAGHPARTGTDGLLGAGTAGLAADRLSGMFLVIAFGAAIPVSLAFAGWAARGRSGRRGLGASYGLALGAVAVVLIARDAFTLLFAWEALTVAFYLLAGFERGREGRPAAAMVTLAFGKVSGVSLLAGLLLLATRSGSLRLDAFASVSPGGLRTTALVLLLLGFAVKVGLVPLQIWLPRGYAAAPAPARAVMAGVAVNVGFYGLWRTLALLGPPPGWLTGTLLVLAGSTAVLGIAHAAVQDSLARVIAYSSVENAGLILAGFGVALVGATVRDERLVAAGMLAATLQVIAHAAAKPLLFTASAGLEEAGRSDDLDQLRGMARRAPWSGTGLAVGGLTLAGLPLTAGFVSEWFLLEALMQQFRVPGLGFRLVLAIAGAAVALTAGFAGVTFVRLVGLVVLGPSRPDHIAGRPDHNGGRWPGYGDGRPDHGLGGRVAVVTLSAACLVLAMLTPLEIRVVASGLSPVVPAGVTDGALKSPWVVEPVFAGFSILSPSWLWIVMPMLLLVTGLLAWAASGGRMLRVRRVPPWRSATATVTGASGYTAFGFANPTRRVLAAVLRTRAGVRPITPQPDDSGKDPAATAAGTRQVPRLGYTSDVIEVTEQYLYRPVLRPLSALGRAARRLQSGRLDAYLAYMLIALVAVLAVVAALA